MKTKLQHHLENELDREFLNKNIFFNKNISQQNIKLAFNFESETKNQIIDNFNSYFINKDINLFNNLSLFFMY